MEQKSTGGYLFSSNEDAILARGEEQKIAAIKQKLNFDNPQTVLQVYQKAVENRLFTTPVGFAFLHELQEYLVTNQVTDEEVPPIPVPGRITTVQSGELMNRKKSGTAAQKKDYRRLTHMLAAACTILACGILVMLYIALSAKNPNILNYRKAITNEYSTWEEELSEREAIVREKELELKLSE